MAVDKLQAGNVAVDVRWVAIPEGTIVAKPGIEYYMTDP
jgi:hypothetical protein